jgi:hypothetical protein
VNDTVAAPEGTTSRKAPSALGSTRPGGTKVPGSAAIRPASALSDVVVAVNAPLTSSLVVLGGALLDRAGVLLRVGEAHAQRTGSLQLF